MTERLVDISKVDPNNCDEIEMFAYSSHLTASGKCPTAQKSFMGAKSNHDSEKGGGNLFDKENWMDIVKEIGANTLRLAHYQHAQEFYDLCDENGIIVWAEIPYITMHMNGGKETVTFSGASVPPKNA